MLLTYNEFKTIYGNDAATEAEFDLYAYQAERYVDKNTTGIDGVHKLRVAFPTNEADAETVKRCIAAISSLLISINNVSGGAGSSNSKGRIASMSSGSESISYSYAASLAETISGDKTAQEKAISGTVRDWLSGVTDANGVNLLYMGAYPIALEEEE